MKAFHRLYSSNLMSKLPLDEKRGYLHNCLSSSCQGNLEQILDMGDIQSIDACLDALNGHDHTSPPENPPQSYIGKWKSIRTMMSPVLTSRKLKAMLPHLDQAADDMLDFKKK
ncbi:unnamed protein product [Lepeophtheirus salmonis]|uniref:(salmon louse) hypothetical protein n=1 Tax=Lepeophtheirus salmonis TaxID=72036 RepID=A0A7R8H4G8_LEPSM|nr:unnamed protein product [Lepeophtheirus salmonis]CAF2847133.1 unnamed protein product [Lepeophtheirus salmonis]